MFGSAKYRNYFYGADDHIAVVHTEKISKYAALFISIAINKVSYTGKFHYGRNFYAKDADELNIMLPTQDGIVDYDFMESFIAKLEAEHVAKLEAYLSAAGLKDYTLTKEEQRVLDDFKDKDFTRFDIVEIFNVKNTRNILSSKIVENSGVIPYLCASAENNSVSSHIIYDENYLEEGNCIFIGGKTFVVTYQKDAFYSNDSHNLALYLQTHENRTELIQLYIATCVKNSLGHKYSWGDSISNKKILKDQVLLPTCAGKPDYAFMETFISAIQKLIIKDVVLYADAKIEATKHAVEAR